MEQLFEKIFLHDGFLFCFSCSIRLYRIKNGNHHFILTINGILPEREATMNMRSEKGKKSKLVPVGILLILLGLLLPRLIANMAQVMTDSAVKSLLFILTDTFRLCFFIGLICSIIGGLRNRKIKKQSVIQKKSEN
jgi:hypothetical protein